MTAQPIISVLITSSVRVSPTCTLDFRIISSLPHREQVGFDKSSIITSPAGGPNLRGCLPFNSPQIHRFLIRRVVAGHIGRIKKQDYEKMNTRELRERTIQVEQTEAENSCYLNLRFNGVI
jgi:hypothetical protein